MRVDKYLKNARIIKRRTIAKEACDSERVFINDKVAKAGTEVAVGDVITIEFGNKVLKVEVVEIIESCRKEDATKMYKIL